MLIPAYRCLAVRCAGGVVSRHVSARERGDGALILLLPQDSPALRLSLLLGHALLLAALWLAALPWVAQAAISLVLCVSCALAWTRKPAVHAVQWGVDGRWQLQLLGSGWLDAHFNLSASRAWPWWVHLAFRLEDGRRIGVTLFPDAVEAEALRRLRARLKVEAAVLSADHRRAAHSPDAGG